MPTAESGRLFSMKILATARTMQLAKATSGGTVANIEKQQKQPMEQIVDAGSSADPTPPRTSHLIGGCMTSQQGDVRVYSSGRDDHGQPIILRLEDLAATPHNLERIRERVRILNQQLAASGTPLRLRVV